MEITYKINEREGGNDNLRRDSNQTGANSECIQQVKTFKYLSVIIINKYYNDTETNDRIGM